MIYKTKLPPYHYIENKTKNILNINIIKEAYYGLYIGKNG